MDSSDIDILANELLNKKVSFSDQPYGFIFSNKPNSFVL
jgi:hypothetical protein